MLVSPANGAEQDYASPSCISGHYRYAWCVVVILFSTFIFFLSLPIFLNF